MNIHDRLGEIRRKESRRVIGLISGTSADGVSAVAAEIMQIYYQEESPIIMICFMQVLD